jgi:hypothetical protein
MNYSKDHERDFESDDFVQASVKKKDETLKKCALSYRKNG